MQIYNRYTEVNIKSGSIFNVSYSYICGGGRTKTMDEILKKLRYGDQDRIAVLNAPEVFMKKLAKALPSVQIDSEINARYLYDFMLVFTSRSDEVKVLGPACIHNLKDDGKLWMAYPRGKSSKYDTDINRDHGWESLKKTGFRPVSQVAIADDWSALRFRNSRYIRSAK